MSKPILGYWDLRGIAQPIRFLVAYLGIDVEEKRYDIDEAGFKEYQTAKPNLGLTFANLPYWKENGWNLTETRAIVRYLAREKSQDLMPTQPELLKKADMLENLLWDVWFSLIRTCLNYTDESVARFAASAPLKFNELNNFIGFNKFLLGDQLSYVDFILYEMLHHYTTYEAGYLKPYEGLEKFKKNFETLPAIARYLESPQYVKGPCIHPMFAQKKI